MKRIIFLAAILVLSVFSASCSKDSDVQIQYGTYKLDTKEDTALKPGITLKKDNSFFFFYDPLSSYLNSGEYKIKDNTITCKNDRGDIYLFGIDTDNTIYFIAEGSAEIKPIDERFSAAIEDGSKFIYAE